MPPADLPHFSAILRELSSFTEPIADVRILREPLEELVSVAEKNPEADSTQAKVLCELIDEDYTGPWEALPYLMYRLRWPQLRRCAATTLLRLYHERGSYPCPRSHLERWMEAVIEADMDTWWERDLWEGELDPKGGRNNVFIYVVQENGDLAMAPRFRTFHLDLVKPAGRVRVAGEVKFKDGTIVRITNRDTHYARLAPKTPEHHTGMKTQALIAFSAAAGHEIDPAVFKIHFPPPHPDPV
jgi:hypothetical protein